MKIYYRLLSAVLLGCCLISCVDNPGDLKDRALNGDEKAILKLEKLADANNQEAVVALAELKKEQGDLEAAKELLEQAARLDPKNIKLQMDVADLLNSPEDQERVYKTIIALDPKNLEYHLKLAKIQKFNKDKVTTYKSIIELDPKNIDAYFQLGDLYNENLTEHRRTLQGDRHTQDNREARKYYEKILEIDPKNIDVYNKLASIAKNDEAALRYYEKIIELHPNHFETYRTLWDMYYSKEYWEQIQLLLDKLAEQKPTITDVEIYNSLLAGIERDEYHSSEDKNLTLAISMTKNICDIKINGSDNTHESSNQKLINESCNKYDVLQKLLRDLQESEEEIKQ